jgi:hypothetical protein
MGVFGRKALAVRVEQLTSHPEVNQENATAFEPDNQILATAIERRDSLSFELGGHFGGADGPGQARIDDLDPLEAAADEFGLESCPDGLDLGKLWHGRQRSEVDRRVGRGQATTSIRTLRSGGGSSAST